MIAPEQAARIDDQLCGAMMLESQLRCDHYRVAMGGYSLAYAEHSTAAARAIIAEQATGLPT